MCCLLLSCSTSENWADGLNSKYYLDQDIDISVFVDTISYTELRDLNINDELITTDGQSLIRLSCCNSTVLNFETKALEVYKHFIFDRYNLGMVNKDVCKQLANYDRVYSYVNDKQEVFVITKNFVLALRIVDDMILITDSFSMILPEKAHVSVNDFLNPTIVKVGTCLYFPIYEQQYSMSTFNFIGKVDLLSHKVSIHPIFLPDFHVETDLSLSDYITLFNLDNNLGVAFSFKPIAFIINLEQNHVDTICFKSKYDTTAFRLQRKDDNLTKFVKTDIYKARYLSFCYNPQKKHFYVVHQFGQSEFRSDGLKNTAEDRRCSFLVLDEQFEIVAEQILPYGVYNAKTIYPTKDGAFFLSSLSEEYSSKHPYDYQKLRIIY